MSKTLRTLGISAFLMLVVCGTGWAVEKRPGNSHSQVGAAVTAPATENDAVTEPLSRESLDLRPGDTDSSQEYDRSDLILSQG
jgi:hypothetical protein